MSKEMRKYIDTFNQRLTESENFNISDVSESQNQKLPNKSGWFWVLIEGYDEPTPCWYMDDSQCFLPGGLGDSSSMGIYEDEIEKVGPEIIVPYF